MKGIFLTGGFVSSTKMSLNIDTGIVYYQTFIYCNLATYNIYQTADNTLRRPDYFAREAKLRADC